MEDQEQQEAIGLAQQELLYHYTTQEGLLGIVEDKKIWASHLQYLNDTSEGKIFTELFRDELNQRRTTGSEEPLSQFWRLAQLMRPSVDHPEG